MLLLAFVVIISFVRKRIGERISCGEDVFWKVKDLVTEVTA